MKLVKRSDGMMLNLNAVMFFTPQGDNMIVEMPGGQFYIINDFYSYFIHPDYDGCDVHYTEFSGWPK